MARGLVVASHQAAAAAGAAALAAGGSAADAAVATAFALAVVEPAQCGLGGYGGFLTYRPAGGEPFQVAFNTFVPPRLAGLPFGGAVGGDPGLADGGGAVAPPAVVPGLLAAHRAAGRLPLADLLAPAVRLARDGFAVGPALARAFADHWERTGGGAPSFAEVFFPEGRPPRAGERLRQPELAGTLERLDPASLADAICATVRADGGLLEPEDIAEAEPAVEPAARLELPDARLFGAAPAVSGAGILFAALAALDPGRLGENRGESYVRELARVLREAWAERARVALGELRAADTTHLCTADAEGSLASLTFTHGRRKFGSGLVARGTGVVLNAGVALLARSPEGPRAVTNMAPVILEDGAGTLHGLGGVGGPRIPAMMLTAVVDVTRYGIPLAEALAAPHLAVRPTDGRLEAEPSLFVGLEPAHDWSALEPGEAFGPACGITLGAGGEPTPAVDPRFGAGVAVVGAP